MTPRIHDAPAAPDPGTLPLGEVEINRDVIRDHLSRAQRSNTPTALRPCADDALLLLGEVERLEAVLATTSAALGVQRGLADRARTAERLAAADHARLVAAARAAVAGNVAALAAELEHRGLLPTSGAAPDAMLADAAGADPTRPPR